MIHDLARRLGTNIQRVIVGKDAVIDQALAAVLCEGHILMEDVPGIGKTTLARALAASLGCTFQRIQFTPDLLPSDVTGINWFNQKEQAFEFRPGPLMGQVVLVDEINRATPRTQSALQLTGVQDMDLLVREMQKWIKGNWYEKRAAAASLAEPRLLKQPKHAKQVLQILDRITASMEKDDNARDDSYKVLRQGMAYCWSVAVAALPDEGKPMMEQWFDSDDKDIRWVMKENLKKNRLVKIDAAWVQKSVKRLG